MLLDYFRLPQTVENSAQNKHLLLPYGIQAKFQLPGNKSRNQTVNVQPHFSWLADGLTD